MVQPEDSRSRSRSGQILITNSFRRNLKRLRRHFSAADVVSDVRRFATAGLGPGESRLKKETLGKLTIEIVKLRIKSRDAVGRYLLGIIGESIYLPVFIDLKTGRYGRNLSFRARRDVTAKLETAFETVLTDYLEHTEEEPKLEEYPL